MPTGADNSGTYRWYGLYAKQHEYATVVNSSYQTNVKSAMIYGSMYDAVMNWTLYGTDNTDANKVKSPSESRKVKQPTGATENDKIKNIYDLGNNLGEWTAEVSSTNQRNSRGSDYESTRPPGGRFSMYPNDTSSSFGSRLLLY